jgi:membrane associated rhomboid family serine protease
MLALVEMPPPPRWSEFPRYPVIAGTILIAVAVTIAWWAKYDVSIVFATAEIRRGQLWRLFTTIFPHLDLLHLVFNVYWLWVLGSLLEGVFGHAKTAALLVLFAVGSSSFEFAFAQTGVGLSGVGYGFFGLLWVLSRRDERFRGSMDQRTVTVFVVWFFFCLATTLLHIFVVANVAHGAGAILGILAGFAITMPSRRPLFASAVAALVAFGLWGSTYGRPLVNLSGKAGFEEGQWGYAALVANHNEEAVRWLRDATAQQPKSPELWIDLAIAYHRLGNIPAATAAYNEAHKLKPDDPAFAVPKDM